MKKQSIIYFFALSCIFISCTKNEHWLRVQNAYEKTTISLSVGSTQYNHLPQQSLSNYKLIDGGVMKFKGSIDSITASDKFQVLIDSSISINGDGQHYWTCTLGKGVIKFEKDE